LEIGWSVFWDHSVLSTVLAEFLSEMEVLGMLYEGHSRDNTAVQPSMMESQDCLLTQVFQEKAAHHISDGPKDTVRCAFAGIDLVPLILATSSPVYADLRIS
jgi:hypothetical protein